MPIRRFTATTLAKLPAPRTGSIDFFDAGQSALALRVSRHARSWCVFARLNGRLRRVTLGHHPEMGLAEARQKATELAAAFHAGRDPTAEDQKNTVAAVARNWLTRVQSKNRTHASVERMIEREVIAKIGHKPIASVRKADIYALIEAVADRGAEVQARRLATYVHGLFEWALARELVQVNPATHLDLPGRDVARDRVLAPAELRLIWQASLDPALGLYGPCLRVLALTAARRSEIDHAKWSELDLTDPAGATIRLPAERSKNNTPRVIPLADAARDLILALPRTTSPYVFPSASGAPIARWSSAKARIDAASGVASWRLHDLRRTAATNLQRLGVKLEVIETVLGHVSGSRSGIVGIYQRHAFADEARHAISAWSAELARITSDVAPDTNVIPLSR